MLSSVSPVFKDGLCPKGAGLWTWLAAIGDNVGMEKPCRQSSVPTPNPPLGCGDVDSGVPCGFGLSGPGSQRIVLAGS